MIKKILFGMIFLLNACGFLPTPDDFPSPPPITPIVEWPQVTATATLEPRLRPILPDDLQDAKTLFLIVKTSLAAGNDTGIAELVKYPIRVRINGQETLLQDESEFLDHYERIFDQEFTSMISEIDESDLLLLSNGIQVGKGVLWFNYYCIDPACSEAQFLITQINK